MCFLGAKIPGVNGLKYFGILSQDTVSKTNSEIFTPNDEHPCLFHMGAPLFKNAHYMYCVLTYNAITRKLSKGNINAALFAAIFAKMEVYQLS